MNQEEKASVATIRQRYVARLMANGEGRRRARREARKWVRGSMEGNT
jgi:hypothetical protein